MSTSHGGTARCEIPHAVNHALFGRMLGLTGLAVANSSKTEYLYGGKELPQLFGIDWYDSAARWLTTSGAFVSPDPLMEKYYSISPYAYIARILHHKFPSVSQNAIGKIFGIRSISTYLAKMDTKENIKKPLESIFTKRRLPLE